MSGLPVSVIVVSRNRPALLRRCLLALGQLEYPRFELVVVACPDGAAAVRAVPQRCDRTVLDFDEANIARARNIGIRHARGVLVAFIDDDAVPEPTWLRHLAPVFDAPGVVQAGGTTLGRNGISVQHGAAQVDGCGVTHPVAVSGRAPVVIPHDSDRFPRLHGTNMVLRRDAVEEVGGFDARYRFYLDETDLTRRLSAFGTTVFVPEAVVHHASAASVTRRQDRVPRNLYEIGASAAVFHHAHCPPHLRDGARDAFLAERRAWLLRHMQAGSLTPEDVHRLLRQLARGYAEGGHRPPLPATLGGGAFANPITEFANPSARDTCLVATAANRRQVMARARSMARAGERVTVLDFRPNTLFHHVHYTVDGFWLHRGGLYGRERRSEPLFRFATRSQRVTETLTRLEGVRAVGRLKPDN